MSAPTEHPAEPRPQFVTLTPQELAARKRRNLALAGALVGFIILVFLVTVLNLQRNVADRKAAAQIPAAAQAQAAPAAS